MSIYFFFSSRRRHTRFDCDWSSDVCSSDLEYTGDGHALAYEAGAELIDMEFVQFHPTGMVWPPSVRGILVTEGVRGEGGVLKNAAGERFMFRYMQIGRAHV